MATLGDVRRLLAFDDWAKTQVLRALGPLDSDVPAAVARKAHVMAAIDYIPATRTGAI